MKSIMATVAAVALLAGISAASAQTPAPADKSIHQSAGDRDSRGTPKQATRPHLNRTAHLKKKRHGARSMGAETTGANRIGNVGGPRNDPSIHQSIGRDSRGTPKGLGNQ